MGETDGTLWMPEQISTFAGEVDWLFYFVYWVSVVFFVGVVGSMTYFAIKYRRRDPNEVPLPLKEHKLMEASWIVVPTLLVLLVFNWGFKTYLHLSVAPPDAYVINVTAKKWLWEFEYPNGVKTAGEVHVPVDRPVKFQMSSTDVLHSMFIPVFRAKHDVLPNRYTSVWFQAEKEGTYDIFCTEYCGQQHSGMLAKIVVDNEAAFGEWLASQDVGNLSPLEYGERLYTQQNCAACHSIDGSRMVGPTFQGLWGAQRVFEDGGTAVADANYLRESILQPMAHIVQGYPAAMPQTYSTLDEAQVTGLIAYIESLAQ